MSSRDDDYLVDGALMGWGEEDSPGRVGLGIDRWNVLRRFEREPAAPESWTQPVEGPGLCPCGHCAGHGTLRIDTTGAEEWAPCREAGGLAYLPDPRGRWER